MFVIYHALKFIIHNDHFVLSKNQVNVHVQAMSETLHHCGVKVCRIQFFRYELYYTGCRTHDRLFGLTIHQHNERWRSMWQKVDLILERCIKIHKGWPSSNIPLTHLKFGWSCIRNAQHQGLWLGGVKIKNQLACEEDSNLSWIDPQCLVGDT